MTAKVRRLSQCVVSLGVLVCLIHGDANADPDITLTYQVHYISNCSCSNAKTVEEHSHDVSLLNASSMDCEIDECPDFTRRTASLSVDEYTIPVVKHSNEKCVQEFSGTITGADNCDNDVYGCVNNPQETAHYLIAYLSSC